MKRLKTGAVNTLSFVKNIGYVVNEFDVTLEKVVGNGTLSLTELQDLNGLDTCKDFIQLNIDLVAHSLEGGEYYLTLNNGDSSVKYLCNVESYSYQTHGTDIYSDSVVLGSADLSNLNSGQSSDSGSTAGSADSTGSTDSTNTDPNYNPNTDPTNSWNGLPLLTWDNVTIELNGGEDANTYILSEQDSVNFFIDNLPPEQGVGYTTGERTYEVLITLTDSDSNSFTYTKSFMVDTENAQYADNRYFSISNVSEKGLNGGDIATIDVTLSNKNDIKATAQFTLLLPPKVNFYIAESLSDAQGYHSNGEKLNFTELDNLTTANLYTYVEENIQASMYLTSTEIVSSFMFVTNLPTNTFVNQPINASAGILEESFTGIDLTPEQYAPASFKIQLGCSWDVNGVTYSRIAEEINNTGVYSFDLPLLTKTFTNKLYDGSVITLNGVDFNVTGDRLLSSVHPTLGDQTQLLSNNVVSIQLSAVEPGVYPKLFYFQNNGSNTKVMSRETYTDGTIVERSSITPNTINFNNTNIDNGIDPWGLVSFAIAEPSKTLESVSVWLRFASDYIYNIDNGSINSPEFYFEP